MFLQRNTSTYHECLLTTNETLSIYLLVSNFGAIRDNTDMCPNLRARNSAKQIYSREPILNTVPTQSNKIWQGLKFFHAKFGVLISHSSCAFYRLTLEPKGLGGKFLWVLPSSVTIIKLFGPLCFPKNESTGNEAIRHLANPSMVRSILRNHVRF